MIDVLSCLSRSLLPTKLQYRRLLLIASFLRGTIIPEDILRVVYYPLTIEVL